MTVRVSVDIPELSPKDAFQSFVFDLTESLKKQGIDLDRREIGGEFIQGESKIGRITKMDPSF